MKEKPELPLCPECKKNDRIYRMRNRWTKGGYETIWCCSRCNVKFTVAKKEGE